MTSSAVHRANKRILFCMCLAAIAILAAGGCAAADLSASAPRATTVAPKRSSWWFDLRSTTYPYQSETLTGQPQDRLPTYQNFSGAISGMADGRLTFRTSGRFAEDLRYDRAGIERGRLHIGHLEARFHPRARARLGRQFVQAGVGGLTLDGLWLNVRTRKRLDATAWAGARTRFDHGFATGEFGANTTGGAQVVFRPNRKNRLSVSGAYREDGGRVAERPVGFEFASTAVPSVRAFGRAAYDLRQQRWNRLETRIQWQPDDGLPELAFQLVDRSPTVDATSYFSRFVNAERIRIIRSSARFERASEFGGELNYFGSFIDVRKSHRFGAAVLMPGGRIGYSARIGDAGEEDSLFGELSHQVTRWLRVEGEATFLTYALMSDAPESEERDLVTLAGRMRATLRPGVRLMAEVQSLKNPNYDKDVRFLIGLDVSMARGSSRFGLDRGGWLK